MAVGISLCVVTTIPYPSLFRCHSLSHIVRGLAPGESYVFRVRAENMHGSSEASLESTPVYILQTGNVYIIIMYFNKF